MRTRSESQPKPEHRNITIICMIVATLVLLFTFLLQLKDQNQAQAFYIANLNSQTQPSQTMPHPTSSLSPPQPTTSTNPRDHILRHPTTPYDHYLFDTLENWYDKQQVQATLKKQKDQGLFNPTSFSKKPVKSNYVDLPTQSPDPPTSFPSAKPTGGKPTTAISRAGITSQQLQFAKKLLELKTQSADSETAVEQKKYYQQKYNVSAYPQQPFCIVIPSYNNVAGDRYIKNINTILQQDYSNFHVIFFDDMSDDGTGRLMLEFAQKHQISQHKLKVVINKQRTMAMPNLYKAAKQYCKPYEIYMVVDGDDELVGRQVFKFFNAIFQSQNLWVMYSNFISVRGSIGYSRPYSVSTIQRNGYRKSGFVISHLRAFYTKLFSNVKQQDLKDEEGKWFRAANDVAMYMPILEQTHKKVNYVPEISYMYNSNTGLNNHKVKLKQQKGNEKKVKQKPSYTALEELFTEQEKLQLKNSLNQKIDIKDTNLPIPTGEIKKQGWEM